VVGLTDLFWEEAKEVENSMGRFVAAYMSTNIYIVLMRHSLSLPPNHSHSYICAHINCDIYYTGSSASKCS
jgi:hypothetical protein